MRRIVAPFATFGSSVAEQQGSKIEELESIRGVAAVLVVLFHMPFWNLQLYNVAIIRNSYYMVDLFFVLSGFVMFLNYGDRLRSTRDLVRFQLLRIGRLYPVHLLFLLVALLMAAGKWLAAMKLGIALPNGDAFKGAGLQAFVEQLLLAHALGFSNNALSFNEPSWSISVEFYTYLVFGLLTLIPNRVAKLSTYLLVSAASLALLQLAPQSIGNFSYILQCFAGYFMGCLIAAWCTPGRSQLPSVTGFVVLALLLLFLEFASGGFNVLIYFLSAALIIAVILGQEGRFRSMLRQRLFAFLGMISYSLYMSHHAVLWVCNTFVRVALKRPEAVIAGISYPQLSIGEAVIANVVAVGLTIALSTMVYRWIEDPLRHQSRTWIRKHLPAPAPAAVAS